MALLNSDNKYIRVLEDGSYFVYPSVSAREREKNATSSSLIIEEYKSRLKSLEDDLERRDYDTDNWNAEWSSLNEEYLKYLYNLEFFKYDAESSYLIMAQVYPDVRDSIPEIIESGQIMVSPNTSIESVDDRYEFFKEKEFFGMTEDV